MQDDKLRDAVIESKAREVRRVNKMFNILGSIQVGSTILFLTFLLTSIFTDFKNKDVFNHTGVCIMWLIYSVSYSIVARELRCRVKADEILLEVLEAIDKNSKEEAQ